MGEDTPDVEEIPDIPPHGVALGVISEGVALASGSRLGLGALQRDTAARVVSLILTNPSMTQVTLIGVPEDWLSAAPEGVLSWGQAPPEVLEPGGSAPISIVFTPSAEGQVQGTLSLPYAQAEEPFTLHLSGEVEAPPEMVLVGPGARVTASFDYGASWDFDIRESNEWHDDTLMRGVTYGQGRFVAVGGATQAVFWTSEDGRSWSQRIDSDHRWISDVAYGNGRFVAAGGFGNLAVSEDGDTWIHPVRDFGPHLRTMVYGNGVFVAVGADRRAVTVDGTEWISDLRGMPGMGLVVFGNGVFVATGSDGRLAVSSDGIEWDDMTIGTAGRRVAFGGGIFVASGWPDNPLTSSDGLDWEEHEPDFRGDPIGYINGWFIGIGWRDRILRSTDGVAWALIRDNTEGEPPGYNDMAAALEVTP